MSCKFGPSCACTIDGRDCEPTPSREQLEEVIRLRFADGPRAAAEYLRRTLAALRRQDTMPLDRKSIDLLAARRAIRVDGMDDRAAAEKVLRSAGYAALLDREQRSDEWLRGAIDAVDRLDTESAARTARIDQARESAAARCDRATIARRFQSVENVESRERLIENELKALRARKGSSR